MDIVEIEGRPLAKRGKTSGLKQVWKCPDDGSRATTLDSIETVSCRRCSRAMEPMLKEQYAQGRKLFPDPSPREIRAKVLQQLKDLEP